NPRQGSTTQSYDYWNEALHGAVGVPNATMFPSATGMGSNWNKDLMLKIGTIIGNEVRVQNNLASSQKGLSYWSPTLNIYRDPRWGRADESYGEDPYHIGQIGAGFIKGMQGTDKKYLKAISTPKHYFANNSESNRRNGNSQLTEREIREYYTPAFAYAMGPEVGAYSYMTAYNRVNNEPISASSEFLRTMPMRQWGFKGYVTSDCSAIYDIYQRHRWQPEGWDHRVTNLEGVAWSIKAGTDIDCQGNSYRDHLVNSYNAGLATDNDLDRELVRLLEGRFRLGHFDPADVVPWRAPGNLTLLTPSTSNGILPNNVTVGSPGYAMAQNSRDVSKQASDEAPVLLKNKVIEGKASLGLPLSKTDDLDIQVVGYHASVFTSGGYSGNPPTAITTQSILRTQLNNGAPAGTTVSTVMNGINATTSPKPGISSVYFLDDTLNVTGQANIYDTSNGHITSIYPPWRPDVFTHPDLPLDTFLTWEGWQSISWGAGTGYVGASSTWGGYFMVRHHMGATDTRVCTAMTGSGSPGAQWIVHEGSMTGPIVATLPADGTNGSCAARTGTVWNVNNPSRSAQMANVIINETYDLWFVYDVGNKLGDYGTAQGPGNVFIYNLSPTQETDIQNADAVVMGIGTVNGEAAEETDRYSIDLPRFQDELVNKVAALNPHTVVWIQSMGQMNIEKFKNNPNVSAIVWTNYNGMYQGFSAADILWGEVNPSGKLPFTWYSDQLQLGSVWDYGITPESSGTGLGRTYQYFDGAVSYPFGFGLSYSTFSYDNLQLSKSVVTGDDVVSFSVEVTKNAGRAAKETVELYVSAPGANGHDRPYKQLKGFTKLNFTGTAADTQTAIIKVPMADLWFWDDVEHHKVWDLGVWTVQVGPSSAPTGAKTATFNLTAPPTPSLDVVAAIPTGTILHMDAPDNVIYADMSATRSDQSFLDLADPEVSTRYWVKNPTIAKVSADGVVSPVGAGVTTVFASTSWRGLTKTDSFPIVVKGADTGAVIEFPDRTIPLAEAKAGITPNAQIAGIDEPGGDTVAWTYSINIINDNTADGAIDAAGVITAGQAGQFVLTATAVVTFGGGGTQTITRESVITVIPDPTVAITGKAEVGQTLTANVADTQPGATITYQWMRDGVAIPGATAKTYKVQDADVGAQLTVQAVVTPGGTAVSAPTAKVPKPTPPPPIKKPTVSVSGQAVIGQTLTAVVKDAAAGSKVAYQWLRDGKPIAGATGKTYKVTKADIGAQLSVQAVVTPGGTAVSAKTAKVPAGSGGQGNPGQQQIVLSPSLAGAKYGDVLRVDTNGDLWRYPSSKTGALAARVKLGSGFGAIAV
ncbi:MAG: glycoside hydrolase family 3 C-terminal domain-containing protein, partial [Micrococcales bacterium]|nr:glycoside hydrolase family 3 C-terminal domain-containing protein [Micrococcales bacterium]